MAMTALGCYRPRDDLADGLVKLLFKARITYERRSTTFRLAAASVCIMLAGVAIL
jgi:hypothetical protein